MKRPISEVVVHLVLMGLAGYFLMESFSIRGSAAGGSLSPAFFPKAICALLLMLLGLSLFKVVHGMVAHRGEIAELSVSPAAVRPVISWVAVFLQLVIYAVALERLGYIVSTSLLVFCVVGTLVILGTDDASRISIKGVAQLGAFSAIVSVTIFYLFSKGFGIILPTLGVMGV